MVVVALMNGKQQGIQFLAQACLCCMLLGGLIGPLGAVAEIDSRVCVRSVYVGSVCIGDTFGAEISGSDLAVVSRFGCAADEQDDPTDLEVLRGMLEKSGPEGKDDRESAVAQLLAMAQPEAHRLLQEYLRRKQDPDGLRLTILVALQNHLRASLPTQFGGAKEAVRKLIIMGYLNACAPLWSGADGVMDVASAPVLIAARLMLRQVPVRELDIAARTLMTSIEDAGERALVLRCLADMQQTLLAKTIADQLENEDLVVRAGAEEALQLLTYADDPIRTKAGFDAWLARFGSLRYIDLAERAARNGPSTTGRLRDDLERERVKAARDIVSVLVVPKPTVDWTAVQAQTLSDGPTVLQACLQVLQTALAQTTSVDGPAVPRQAFFRALLDRLAQEGESEDRDVQQRRALLLEVAAYLVNPDEVESANEIRSLLVTHLSSPSVVCQAAALRGLRRFPSAAARLALVSRASQLLADSGGKQELLQVMLETLASPLEPRWKAPSPGDADKAAWLKLINDSCRTASELGLRTKALRLAQTQTADRTNVRVPEAFGVLLALAKDAQLDTQFRATCLIYLDVWLKEKEIAEQWLGALYGFLEDDQAALRLQAASSLANLPASNDRRLDAWYTSTMSALGARLKVESDLEVLKALVECVIVIGRQPSKAAESIRALESVLAELGDPVEAENAFRLEPVLKALGQIAAQPNTQADQWLTACGLLLKHADRQSLRLVLRSQDAISSAKDVGNPDKSIADRATKAMRFLIEAAGLRTGEESWGSSPDLQAEARDVRSAFKALDTIDAAQRLELPRHRLLRLQAALVAEDYQEIVERATAWLQAAAAQPSGQDAAYLDLLRLLSAEAQLELAKPLLALAVLDKLSAAGAADASALALFSRIGNVLPDPEAAIALLDRTLRATSADNPLFRVRLLDWMRASIRHKPETRKDTIDEARRYAGLFEAADCPSALRTAFEQLCSPN